MRLSAGLLVCLFVCLFVFALLFFERESRDVCVHFLFFVAAAVDL